MLDAAGATKHFQAFRKWVLGGEARFVSPDTLPVQTLGWLSENFLGLTFQQATFRTEAAVLVLTNHPIVRYIMHFPEISSHILLDDDFRPIPMAYLGQMQIEAAARLTQEAADHAQELGVVGALSCPFDIEDRDGVLWITAYRGEFKTNIEFEGDLDKLSQLELTQLSHKAAMWWINHAAAAKLN